MQLIRRHGLWPSRVPVVHELRQLLRQFSRHCTSCGKHEFTGTVSQEPQLATTTSLCEQAIFVGDLSWHYDMALTRFRSQALLKTSKSSCLLCETCQCCCVCGMHRALSPVLIWDLPNEILSKLLELCRGSWSALRLTNTRSRLTISCISLSYPSRS